MEPIRIGVVGLGKIARDQHLPAIRRSPDFDLAFVVDPVSSPDEEIPVFPTLDAVFEAGLSFDAVAVCTPPQPRMELCRKLLEGPCALLLEKPPAQTLAAAESIRDLANARAASLYAAWHSRHSPHMEMAKDWARRHALRSGSIEWRENAAKWHPGQGWLWQAGGFGVFDPGINALSILTALYPINWEVRSPVFRIPANARTPIAADFELAGGTASLNVAFEFHSEAEEIWTIRLVAENGDVLELSDGGATLSIGGRQAPPADVSEYDGVYQHFAGLVRAGKSDFDLAPLAIVEQAFGKARMIRTDAIDY